MDKWKRVSLCFGLVSLILVVSMGYVLYSYAVSPTSTFVVSGGVYPGAPTWTIWVESGTYFAKNSNGQIVYSGTNSTEVILYASAATQPNGGIIQFLKGTYYDVDIYCSDVHNIVFQGSGSGSNLASSSYVDRPQSTIWMGKTASYSIIGLTNSSKITIQDISFIGGNTAQYAISSVNSKALTLSGNYFANFTVGCIRLVGYHGYTSYNEICNNIFSLEDPIGVTDVYGVLLQGHETSGLAEGTNIYNNNFFTYETGEGYGIYFAEPDGGGATGQIDSMNIYNNGFYFLNYGIYIQADIGSIVHENNFEENVVDIALDNTAYDIDTQFYNNKHSYFDPLIISQYSTHFHGKAVNNIGFLTENSGTATGTSPITVASGLIAQAEYVTLGANGTAPLKTSWVNLNATHFDIYHDGGGSALVTWYAVVQP